LKLREIEDKRSTESGRTLHEPLFRGLGDSPWTLATTLERAYQLEHREPKPTFLKYYRKVLASKPAIETLSGKRWDLLPEPDEFNPGPDSTRLDKILEKHPGVSEYLVFLRHHGGVSTAHLFVIGPYMRTDQRHYSQQSRYTPCTCLDLEGHNWHFRPHERGLEQALGVQGMAYKITLPAGEKTHCAEAPG
jgi:hypothetical protein